MTANQNSSWTWKQGFLQITREVYHVLGVCNWGKKIPVLFQKEFSKEIYVNHSHLSIASENHARVYKSREKNILLVNAFRKNQTFSKYFGFVFFQD